MKSACSHLCFVNRWVEVSDCEERQSGADTSISSTYTWSHFQSTLKTACTFMHLSTSLFMIFTSDLNSDRVLCRSLVTQVLQFFSGQRH